MGVAALAVGLLGGLCAVGFRQLIHFGQLTAWWHSSYTLDYIRSLPWWWKVITPTIGGLVVGMITYYFAREVKGHGVPEVMEAVSLRGGRIRPRVVVAKMLASGVCIASGGSVGREGPIVQIGSALGSTIGQWLRISQRRLRTLVGCGAAAGIAATFNAPVAGALFAVEIILGDFGVSQFSPIVISSVAATVVSRGFLGDFPAFQVPAYSLISPKELLVYSVLGLLAGIVAVVFIKVLYGLEDVFDKIRLYQPLKTAIGGTIIGLIAIGFPEVFGIGYETIDVALRGDMLWHLLLVLMVLKILAVSVTIGSGGSGGIFAPSLFIGAMMGGTVGAVANMIWPGSVAGPGAYALVGMAAVVGASTHAPITAILIVFELTSEYKIILPLMISCILATLLATRLKKGSIYTLKLLRRGVDIHKGQSLNVLRELKVESVMRRDIVTVSAGTPLMSIVSQFVEHPSNSVFVVDRDHHLRGLITLDEMRQILADPQSLKNLVIAQDLMIESGFPVFHTSDNLADVMKRLGSHSFVVPVVDNGRIVGGIWPEDVFNSYNAEIFKREMATGMASTLNSERPMQAVPVAGDVAIAEIPVPTRFHGKTIAELDIRKRFSVSVVMVKRKSDKGEETVSSVVVADTVLHAGDFILVMGSKDNLSRLESGR